MSDKIEYKYGHIPKPGGDSTLAKEKRDVAMANVMKYLKEEEEMDLFKEKMGSLFGSGAKKRTDTPKTSYNEETLLDKSEYDRLPLVGVPLEVLDKEVAVPFIKLLSGMSDEEYAMWRYNTFGRGRRGRRMLRPPTRGK
jgi:hypothetical protein